MKLRWQEAGHFEPRPPSAFSVQRGRTRVWRWLEIHDGEQWVVVPLPAST